MSNSDTSLSLAPASSKESLLVQDLVTKSQSIYLSFAAWRRSGAIRPEIKMQLKRIQQQSEAFDKTMLSSTVVSRGWTCVASDAAFILKNVRARNTLEPQFVPDILESMKSRARSVAKEAKLVKGSFVAFRKDLAQIKTAAPEVSQDIRILLDANEKELQSHIDKSNKRQKRRQPPLFHIAAFLDRRKLRKIRGCVKALRSDYDHCVSPDELQAVINDVSLLINWLDAEIQRLNKLVEDASYSQIPRPPNPTVAARTESEWEVVSAQYGWYGQKIQVLSDAYSVNLVKEKDIFNSPSSDIPEDHSNLSEIRRSNVSNPSPDERSRLTSADVSPLIDSITTTLISLLNSCYQLQDALDALRLTAPANVINAVKTHRKRLLQLIHDSSTQPEISVIWYLASAMNVAVDVSYVAQAKVTNHSDLRRLLLPAAKRVINCSLFVDDLLEQEGRARNAWEAGKSGIEAYFEREKAIPGRHTKRNKAVSNDPDMTMPNPAPADPNLTDWITILHVQLHTALSSFAQFWNDQSLVVRHLFEGRDANQELEKYITGWIQAGKASRRARDDIGLARDVY